MNETPQPAPMHRPCTALAVLTAALRRGRTRLLVFALLVFALPSLAEVRTWRADILDSEEVRNEYVRRGDAGVTFRIELYVRSRPYCPETAEAVYRTNLLDRTELHAPCTVASNVVSMAWTPMLAPGADVVPMVIHVDGEVYRAPVMVYVRDSPGGDGPWEKPLLDLAGYRVANAPWIETEADPVALHRLASPAEKAEIAVDELGVVRSLVRAGAGNSVCATIGGDAVEFGGPVDTGFSGVQVFVPGAAAGRRMSREDAEAGWHVVTGESGDLWSADDWTLRHGPGHVVAAYAMAGETNLVEIWRAPGDNPADGSAAWLTTAWQTNVLATAAELHAAGDALLAQHRTELLDVAAAITGDLDEAAAAILDELDAEARERAAADDRLAADLARRLLLDDPDQGRTPVRITAHTSGDAETERRVWINGRLAVGEADTLDVGSDSVAVGAHVAATGDQSFAAGWGNKASGGRSVALGIRTTADSPQAIAAGADAVSTNANAAVWSGVETGGPQFGPPYGSHGTGTWSINPVGGVGGAWIGELPIVGLLPEYLVANETDRRSAYTAESRDTALRDGKFVLLYMAAQPSAAWTLDLTLADGSATGAKPVRFWGTTAVTTQYVADSILPLVYRAGAWYVSDRDANDNTYDRIRLNQTVRYTAKTVRYTVCGADTNHLGYLGLDPGVTIDATRPLLYSARSSAASANGTDSNFYFVYPAGTNFEIDRKLPGKQGSPLYLLGSLSADGTSFTVGDPMYSYEPVPPCYPVGMYHATATNNFYFCPGPLIRDEVSAAANAVTELIAAEVESLPVEATLEVHRLVLADIWNRVDRMAGVETADEIDDIRQALEGLEARLASLEATEAANLARLSDIEAAQNRAMSRQPVADTVASVEEVPE